MGFFSFLEKLIGTLFITSITFIADPKENKAIASFHFQDLRVGEMALQFRVLLLLQKTPFWFPAPTW